eukprot:Em0011g311a
MAKKFDSSKFTKQWEKARRKISVGTCAAEIQCELIVSLDQQVLGAKAGPLTAAEHSVEDVPERLTLDCDRPIQEANGESVTLYDFKPGGSGERYGDPIADAYAVIARANNAILAIADGSDWGPQTREAARSAVRGSMECLNRRLFGSQYPLKTTQDVMNAILQSVHSAHKCILQTEGATSSSLCVAVVCELVRPVRNKNWCVCVANLGDSACFVWSNRKGIVQEVTYSASGRGPYLGRANGDKSDKCDLHCSFLPVHENDTVFLVTNGIIQNFDPVVLLEATANDKADRGSPASEPVALPVLSPEERRTAKLAKLTGLFLNARSRRRVEYLSAMYLVETLISYAIQITDEKRKFLERCWSDVDYINAEDRSSKEHEILKIADDYPGKLDHATAVAYKVGYLTDGQRHTIRKAYFYSPTE